jgi:hypothetical protein
MSIENTLKERGARYGSFEEHATIAQAIQDAFRIYPEKWERLPPVIKQGFTTLADKMARTLNGDEYYDDNYHDIGGYAKLMEDWVKRTQSGGTQLDLSHIAVEHSIIGGTV